jgi:hypothetical protein
VNGFGAKRIPKRFLFPELVGLTEQPPQFLSQFVSEASAARIRIVRLIVLPPFVDGWVSSGSGRIPVIHQHCAGCEKERF